MFREAESKRHNSARFAEEPSWDRIWNRLPALAAPGKHFEDCAKGLQRVLGLLPCPPHIPSPLCIQHPPPSAVTHRALLHQALVALFPHRDTAPAQEEAFLLFSLPVLQLKERLLGSS